MALLKAIKAAAKQSAHSGSAGHWPADSLTQIGSKVNPDKSQLDQWPEWMDLKTLQRYADASDRTIREWIHLPINALPASQVAGGKILVKRSRFDIWLEAHRFQAIDSIDVAGVADEIMNQFRKAA
jgi:hypothetical protein